MVCVKFFKSRLKKLNYKIEEKKNKYKIKRGLGIRIIGGVLIMNV